MLFERGVPGSEFADQIGINRLHVSKVNRGHIIPSQAYIDAACDALALPADRLFSQEALNASYYRGVKR
ncbi:helix-turn-helix domain-containing protein [Nocardioides daphniae]|uniref:helix-turn-helix domain-containing protein n=1 Tax=Nocardioides daphniae TaxID=402297 RepID=UPI0013152443|nr:helix-turn-helix transcriptional regulator [Nocardioides daphniae]